MNELNASNEAVKLLRVLVALQGTQRLRDLKRENQAQHALDPAIPLMSLSELRNEVLTEVETALAFLAPLTGTLRLKPSPAQDG